ncbi:MAG: RNA 2',3'-cyclic phosphodiesterase [Armatimonadetes bacterium]|nr:RNA 2',3'-cyclic phosphodiesterase [Armatimonadota bacterium]
MRLFAGIFPPQEALERVLEVQADLRRHVRVRASWVRSERLHITIRFFGDDGDTEEAAQVVERAVAGVQRFSVPLSTVGGFPNVRRARVGFLDSVGCEELVNLASALEEPGGREPHPHLTLARFRRPVALPSVQFDPVVFEVEEVSLIHSVLGGTEPGYRTVGNWALG